MKETEVAYLAGVFDGEGSISIIKAKPNLKNREKSPRYRLTVSVGMAGEYIPNLFLFSFGGKVYKRNLTKSVKPHWHQQWAWRILGEDAKQAFITLMPFLRLKRDEAELAIRFQSERSGHRATQYTEGELAVIEVQRMLLHNMHAKSEVYNED